MPNALPLAFRRQALVTLCAALAPVVYAELRSEPKGRWWGNRRVGPTETKDGAPPFLGYTPGGPDDPRLALEDQLGDEVVCLAEGILGRLEMTDAEVAAYWQERQMVRDAPRPADRDYLAEMQAKVREEATENEARALRILEEGARVRSLAEEVLTEAGAVRVAETVPAPPPDEEAAA